MVEKYLIDFDGVILDSQERFNKDMKDNKTVVLTLEDGLLKSYFTNISVMTIKKRIEKGIV